MKTNDNSIHDNSIEILTKYVDELKHEKLFLLGLHASSIDSNKKHKRLYQIELAIYFVAIMYWIVSTTNGISELTTSNLALYGSDLHLLLFIVTVATTYISTRISTGVLLKIKDCNTKINQELTQVEETSKVYSDKINETNVAIDLLSGEEK